MKLLTFSLFMAVGLAKSILGNLDMGLVPRMKAPLVLQTRSQLNDAEPYPYGILKSSSRPSKGSLFNQHSKLDYRYTESNNQGTLKTTRRFGQATDNHLRRRFSPYASSGLHVGQLRKRSLVPRADPPRIMNAMSRQNSARRPVATPGDIEAQRPGNAIPGPLSQSAKCVGDACKKSIKCIGDACGATTKCVGDACKTMANAAWNHAIKPAIKSVREKPFSALIGACTTATAACAAYGIYNHSKALAWTGAGLTIVGLGARAGHYYVDSRRARQPPVAPAVQMVQSAT